MSLWNWSPATTVSDLEDDDRKRVKQTFNPVYFIDDLLKGGYNRQ